MATDVIEDHSITEAVGGQPRSTVAIPRTGNVVVRFAKQLWGEIRADKIEDVGAMLTYYAILSLFPMLVFVVTLALLVIDQDTIQRGVAMATEAMPGSTRELVAGYVQNLVDTVNPSFAVGSIAIALWSASRGAAAMSGALNAILDKPETRSWIRRQLIAIGVTVGVAVLMVIALGLLVIGPIAGHWVADRTGLGGAFDLVWGVGRWVGAGLLVMLVWALIYKILPDTSAPLRVFTPGAFAGVMVWLGIGYLFGIYLSHWNRYDATYGALGTGIIFLTWLWLSNIALLLGAEINDVLADLRRHRSAAAAQLADPQDRPGAGADSSRSVSEP